MLLNVYYVPGPRLGKIHLIPLSSVTKFSYFDLRSIS